jgi:hypothetical protein
MFLKRLLGLKVLLESVPKQAGEQGDAPPL